MKDKIKLLHLRKRRFQIEELSSECKLQGCRKLKGSINLWRIRIGDRIIYAVDDKYKHVDITAIKHRSEAYK
jgi:mRNA-degrading endonuclease RelE of RelBE toxin-antitoxin system